MISFYFSLFFYVVVFVFISICLFAGSAEAPLKILCCHCRKVANVMEISNKMPQQVVFSYLCLASACIIPL